MPFLHLMLLGLITCAEDITHSKTNVVLLHSKCTGHTTKETFRDCSVNISLVNQAGRESEKSYSARWPVVTLLQRQAWIFFTCQSWYINPPPITSRLLPKKPGPPQRGQTDQGTKGKCLNWLLKASNVDKEFERACWGASKQSGKWIVFLVYLK